MLKLVIKKEYILETERHKIDVLDERIYQDRYILISMGFDKEYCLYDTVDKKELYMNRADLGEYEIITEEYINDKKWSII